MPKSTFVASLCLLAFVGCDTPSDPSALEPEKTVEAPLPAQREPGVVAEPTPQPVTEPAPEPAPEPVPDPADPVPEAAADPPAAPAQVAAPKGGKACRSSRDCPEGVCVGEGLVGCGGDPGRCAPEGVKCTRDHKAFCGCDGRTFYGSGSCPGQEFAHAGACRPTPADGACLKPSDCESGICEGKGCSDAEPGRCQPKNRTCTTDLVQYCGCDGKTFETSSSCPGRRYRARGSCG